jgi:hypothetical protein
MLPNLKLKVHKDALESLEESLLAVTDYLVSGAIKKYNRSCKRDHIVLAHGGKAFS